MRNSGTSVFDVYLRVQHFSIIATGLTSHIASDGGTRSALHLPLPPRLRIHTYQHCNMVSTNRSRYMAKLKADLAFTQDAYWKFWTDVRHEWPLRLLHLPTTTSYERTGNDIYKLQAAEVCRYLLHFGKMGRNVNLSEKREKSEMMSWLSRPEYRALTLSIPPQMAPQHRKTKFPLDRIYGVLQTYGLRPTYLGQATTLEQLENQFYKALNTRSPMLAQCSLHVEDPSSRPFWQIRQESGVSLPLQDFRMDCKNLCSITKAACGIAMIEGMRYFLKDRVELWKEFEASFPQRSPNEKVLIDRMGTSRHLDRYALYQHDAIWCEQAVQRYKPEELTVVYMGHPG